MNRITTKLQDILADVAATVWLARHSGTDRLVQLLTR